MVNIFSGSVFGATFPNPTDVNVVNVKYNAVMYLDCIVRRKNLLVVNHKTLSIVPFLTTFMNNKPLHKTRTYCFVECD